MHWTTYTLMAAAALPVLIWLYLLCARGRFWLVKPAVAPGDSDSAGSRLVGTHAPRIAVVIPARNEVSVIAGTITSLLAQDFPGSCEIFVVDDNSSDGTADAALAAGRGSVTVLNAPSPPAGWTGKMWALSHGVERALAAAPDFLLFTDADIHHAPDSLQKLTAIAADGRFELVSFMVKLRCDTFAERALIPAFVFFFFLLYPPVWICNPKRKTAGAAGGCILITPAILRKAGGIEAIRGEVIDDCALARRVKSAGGRIWLGLTEETASTRSYETFGEIEKMIARTAFRQLNHSALLLAGTVAGLAITYLMPVALLFTGRPAYALPGLAAWALMTITYLPMVRFYQLSPLWAPLLPAVALFYTASTIHSAFKYWTGRGGEWKGRVQDSGVEG